MKISTKGRYALRMMVDLAENQGEGYVSLKDIAARQEISKSILNRLWLYLTSPECSEQTEAIRAAIVWQKCK